MTITSNSRVKRWAPKSFSGCQTCKRRRIKCDETKPECQRCARSGLQCEGEADHPKGYKKVKKAKRVDSMMDMDEGNVNMAEANARLHKMEQAMERMEALLGRMVGGRHRDRELSGNDDGRDEEDVLDAMQTNAT